MYAIQGRPKDKSENWAFCEGIESVPDLFRDAESTQWELEDWQDSTSDWEYRIVAVKLVVEEEL